MLIYIVLSGGVPPFFETSVTNHGRVVTGPHGPVLRTCDTRSLLLPFPFPSPDVQVWTSGHLVPPASMERGCTAGLSVTASASLTTPAGVEAGGQHQSLTSLCP